MFTGNEADRTANDLLSARPRYAHWDRGDIGSGQSPAEPLRRFPPAAHDTDAAVDETCSVCADPDCVPIREKAKRV